MANTVINVGGKPIKVVDNLDGTYSAKAIMEDGDNATLGSKSSVAVTDPTISADEIALLKGLLKQLQGNGSGATPVSVTGSLAKVFIQDCTVANTEYTIDVNTALGKNGHGGFIKAKSTNTGEVSIAISGDGVIFTDYIPDILAGDAISLDGIEVNSIKVKSTVAGDDVIVEVH